MDFSERGMAYLRCIQEASDARAKLAIVGEIQRDTSIGVDELRCRNGRAANRSQDLSTVPHTDD